MTTKTLIRYSLEQVEDLIFRGFDYRIPDEAMETISNLAMQVGSPSYDRTPVFKKRENFVKAVVTSEAAAAVATTPAPSTTHTHVPVHRHGVGGCVAEGGIACYVGVT